MAIKLRIENVRSRRKEKERLREVRKEAEEREAERVEKRSDILEAEAVLQRLVALLGSSCGKSILKSRCVVRVAACLAVK